MSQFLTADDVAELTGIKRGRDGMTREQLQVMQLRQMGLAFFVNAAGRPIVTKTAIEGGNASQSNKQTWQPAVLSH